MYTFSVPQNNFYLLFLLHKVIYNTKRVEIETYPLRNDVFRSGILLTKVKEIFKVGFGIIAKTHFAFK